MRLFYTPDLNISNVLSEDESRHAIKVLRLSEGDAINCVDGSGTLYKCRIIEIASKKVAVDILAKTPEFNKPISDLHIAIAPTKNMDRFEWFLEKATEIGISKITPIISEHSERKAIKPERLEKILVSAMKQSLTAYKPVLEKLTPFSELIKKISGQRFIAHCNNPVHEFYQVLNVSQPITILIGPEGDFSESEINLALKSNFIPVSLGNRRLRTETAGIAACHTAQLVSSGGKAPIERG